MIIEDWSAVKNSVFGAGMADEQACQMDGCCCICGDIGFADAIVTCSHCKEINEHLYCMRIYFEKYPTNWYCDECEPGVGPVSPASSYPRGDLPRGSKLINFDTVHHDATHSSKSIKLSNETRWGFVNLKKKVATRRTKYIPIYEAVKLSSGAPKSLSPKMVARPITPPQPKTGVNLLGRTIKPQTIPMKFSPHMDRAKFVSSPSQKLKPKKHGNVEISRRKQQSKELREPSRSKKKATTFARSEFMGSKRKRPTTRGEKLPPGLGLIPSSGRLAQTLHPASSSSKQLLDKGKTADENPPALSAHSDHPARSTLPTSDPFDLTYLGRHRTRATEMEGLKGKLPKALRDVRSSRCSSSDALKLLPNSVHNSFDRIARGWDKRKEAMASEMDLMTAAHATSALLGVAQNYLSHVRAKVSDQMDQYDELVHQIIITRHQNQALELECEEMVGKFSTLKLDLAKSQSENDELKARSEADKKAKEDVEAQLEIVKEELKQVRTDRGLRAEAIEEYKNSKEYEVDHIDTCIMALEKAIARFQELFPMLDVVVLLKDLDDLKKEQAQVIEELAG